MLMRNNLINICVCISILLELGCSKQTPVKLKSNVIYQRSHEERDRFLSNRATFVGMDSNHPVENHCSSFKSFLYASYIKSVTPSQVKDSNNYSGTYSDYAAPSLTSLDWGLMFQVLKFNITNRHGLLGGSCSFLIENHYCITDPDTKTLFANGVITGSCNSEGKVSLKIDIAVDTSLFVDEHASIPISAAFSEIAIDTEYIKTHVNPQTTLRTTLSFVGTSYNVEYYDKNRAPNDFIVGVLEDKNKIIFPIGALVLSDARN